eukprot:CAMPEP_0175847118 /NCGR_PEP_ID=MMETSP0107_2-20121207/23173_1 /TAXON_ID=195067 ORGANISM="Goniomonas pacifica, Strain CCMP1869" /NCGR_SAMPLE_ID=MMETSP0107_2 /ASSEMBLY_ACC=CAM_ASM_000203 /LENGTH=299 /DNA_ID=CAMNT_0017161893 /DNA_START=239 /DNA_END=1138 /DNA_ORIENTATION=-
MTGMVMAAVDKGVLDPKPTRVLQTASSSLRKASNKLKQVTDDHLGAELAAILTLQNLRVKLENIADAASDTCGYWSHFFSLQGCVLSSSTTKNALAQIPRAGTELSKQLSEYPGTNLRGVSSILSDVQASFGAVEQDLSRAIAGNDFSSWIFWSQEDQKNNLHRVQKNLGEVKDKMHQWKLKVDTVLQRNAKLQAQHKGEVVEDAVQIHRLLGDDQAGTYLPPPSTDVVQPMPLRHLKRALLTIDKVTHVFVQRYCNLYSKSYGIDKARLQEECRDYRHQLRTPLPEITTGSHGASAPE